MYLGEETVTSEAAACFQALCDTAEEDSEAESPDPALCLLASSLCEQGRGVRRNLPLALIFARAAAESGDKEAESRLIALHAATLKSMPPESRPDVDAEDFCCSIPVWQYLLGNHYEYGWNGKDPSLPDAVYWHRRAVSRGDTAAMYSLGEMYRTGKGGESSAQRAFELFSGSAEGKDVCGYYGLGLCYAEGIGTEKNPGKAAAYMLKANAGIPAFASPELAVYYATGFGVEKDLTAAFSYAEKVVEEERSDPKELERRIGVKLEFLTAADETDRLVLTLKDTLPERLQETYRQLSEVREEDKTPDDPDGHLHVQMRQLELASEQGLPRVQVWMEQAYEMGRFRERSLKKAAALFRAAAEQGSDEGLYHWARMLLSGNGIRKNIEKAVRLLQQAVRKNNTDALMLLADCYRNGTGVSASLKKCEDLYREASRLGDSEAKVCLAEMLMDRPVRTEDGYRPGLEAAEAGNTRAMAFCVTMIAMGKVPGRTAAEGMAWIDKYRKASGDDQGADLLLKILGKGFFRR